MTTSYNNFLHSTTLQVSVFYVCSIFTIESDWKRIDAFSSARYVTKLLYKLYIFLKISSFFAVISSGTNYWLSSIITLRLDSYGEGIEQRTKTHIETLCRQLSALQGRVYCRVCVRAVHVCLCLCVFIRFITNIFSSFENAIAKLRTLAH